LLRANSQQHGKTELEMTEHPNSQTTRRDIASYLSYYNHDRLDYLAPADFEAQLNRFT
jgi:hypothetical protein